MRLIRQRMASRK